MENGQRQEITEQILNKLAYIKTLKENAATPGEAEAAAAALIRMLTKYGLSIMELDARLGVMPKASDFKLDNVNVGSTAMWKRTLLHHIATFNFSETVIVPGSPYVSFVGTEQSLQLVKAMFAWLVLEVNSLTDKAWNSLPYKYGYSARSWKDSYRKGVVAGLGSAMRAARNSEVSAYEGGSSLVVVNQQALKEAVSQLIGKTTTQSVAVRTGSAYNRGYDAGRKVNIGTQRLDG